MQLISESETGISLCNHSPYANTPNENYPLLEKQSENQRLGSVEIIGYQNLHNAYQKYHFKMSPFSRLGVEY